MTSDAEVLPQIRTLVDQRPTYGYRRTGALLNRLRKSSGLPALNHKKPYQFMKQNYLLLTRLSGKPMPERVHEGKVILCNPTHVGVIFALRFVVGVRKLFGLH